MQHASFVNQHGSFACILIVDDHPLYRDALVSSVERAFPDCVIETAGTLAAVIEALDGGLSPDLVMFDLKLPDVTGISGFVTLKERLPDCPIMVISALASHELVQTLLREGAAAYMPKDAPASELTRLLNDISAGRITEPDELPCLNDVKGSGTVKDDEIHPKLAHLSTQQKRVLKLICEGKPNKQIAYELDLAVATVKAHITALLRRLGVQNRTQAVVLVEALQARQPSGDPEARVFLAH